jgi:acyl carrier protein
MSAVGATSLDEVLAALTGFVRDELVPDELKDGFDATTPLLEAGILDSLKTAVLVNFIRDQLGVRLPLAKFEPETFENVAALSAVVCEAGGVPAS